MFLLQMLVNGKSYRTLFFLLSPVVFNWLRSYEVEERLFLPLNPSKPLPSYGEDAAVPRMRTSGGSEKDLSVRIPGCETTTGDQDETVPCLVTGLFL